MIADLYADLGIKRGAPKAEIKAAFRRAAKKHHPDIGGNPETFSRAAIAYSTLGNDEARAHYDATGETQGTRIDPVESQARELIGMILSQLLEREDLLTIDLPKQLRSELEGAKAAAKSGEQAAAALRKKMDRLIAARGKLKAKAEGDADIIGSILSAKIASIEISIRSIEAEVARANTATARAIEIVEQAVYAYKPDKPDPHAKPKSFGVDDIMRIMQREYDREQSYKRPQGSKKPWESPFGP